MLDDDIERVRWIRVQAFGGSLANEITPAQISVTRVVEVDGVVQGILSLLPIAQFFGGASVPSAGIGSVAVASEARGKRVPEVSCVRASMR